MGTIAKILGGFIAILGIVLLVPGIFSFVDGDDYVFIFFSTSGSAILIGLMLWFLNRHAELDLDHRSALVLVTLSWLVAGLLGSLPFYLSSSTDTYLDALFESVSGFTGTGASVITNVEGLDRGILLWRSLTQWLGGLGIIVFLVAVLPALGFSGVQLFRAEVAGPQKDRFTPRVNETARKLWILYTALTVLLGLLLTHAGMNWFDAVNHALTVLGTGGFSTRNGSIASFQNPGVEWIVAVFMLLAAINFTLLFRFIIVREAKALKDSELGAFLSVVIVATLGLWASFRLTAGEETGEALRHAFFAVSSMISSSGYPGTFVGTALAQAVLVLLIVMGGMSGSTAGGLKCIRLLCAFKHLNRQLKKVVHPKAVIPVKVNAHIVPDAVIDAIWGLIFLYLLMFSIAVVALTAEGLDLLSAASAGFAILSNAGPALGYFAPGVTYASMTDFSKVILMIGMLMGRLEFFTLLVLFTPAFWKR